MRARLCTSVSLSPAPRQRSISSSSSTGVSGSSSRTAATTSRHWTSRSSSNGLRRAKIDLAGMVTKRVGLEDVAQAFDDLKAGEVIRSVILF